MKARSITLFFSMILFLLTGCSGKSGRTVQPENETKKQTETSRPIQKKQEKIEKLTYTPEEYQQMGSELMEIESFGTLKIGMPGKEVIVKVGEPVKKSKPETWGTDGETHQKWEYPAKGIVLDMILEEDNAAVNMITVKKPFSGTTQRGIGIGSAQQEVLKAYEKEINPEETDLNKGRIVAGSIYGGIIFQIKQNRVDSIFLGAAAE
jgi:hypothetical protein